jgi:bifunctional non-homologous end joining protein LigD
MLSASARRWPNGREWVLQPKWDGFRLLVDVDSRGRVRGWSRHGTSLTARLAGLLACFSDVRAGTVFDGELVALGERDGRPAQDFAAVTRAVLTADPAATRRLRLVAFDVLRLAGEDLRMRPWRERDQSLRDALPVSDQVRVIASRPATPAAHEAIVSLGFEGTVLKRPGSAYRPGRHSVWVKHKARCSLSGVLVSVRQDRNGQWNAICDVGGRRVHAFAGAHAGELVGQVVQLMYSRVDADGGLREARIRTAASAPDP